MKNSKKQFGAWKTSQEKIALISILGGNDWIHDKQNGHKFLWQMSHDMYETLFGNVEHVIRGAYQTLSPREESFLGNVKTRIYEVLQKYSILEPSQLPQKAPIKEVNHGRPVSVVEAPVL